MIHRCPKCDKSDGLVYAKSLREPMTCLACLQYKSSRAKANINSDYVAKFWQEIKALKGKSMEEIEAWGEKRKLERMKK